MSYAAPVCLLMSKKFSSIRLCCWNDRGLGDEHKCELIRDTVASQKFDVIFVQETKRNSLSDFKKSSFLPRHLLSSVHLDALGSAGGVLVAWNSNLFSCSASVVKRRSVTVHLVLATSNFQFYATNVYGPTSATERESFLTEITDLKPLIAGSWVVAGYFNCVVVGNDTVQ